MSCRAGTAIGALPSFLRLTVTPRRDSADDHHGMTRTRGATDCPVRHGTGQSPRPPDCRPLGRSARVLPDSARHSALHCRSGITSRPTSDSAPLGQVCRRPIGHWSRFLSRQQHPAPADTSCWRWRARCGRSGNSRQAHAMHKDTVRPPARLWPDCQWCGALLTTVRRSAVRYGCRHIGAAQRRRPEQVDLT